MAGSDDTKIRVLNYNTMDKVREFQAHKDFIRCIIIHPTLPYMLTSSDDGFIKVWDFSKEFELFAEY